VKASCSMFSQILKLIPRIEFERIVKETGAEYRSKGLSSWSQFVSMLFCQLGRAHSLREIEGGLKSCEGKLAHLGIEVPARSSLSYANGHRPWQLYEKVFYGLFEKVAAKVSGKRKFRFKNKLVSLDSTVIDLCLSIYDWAKFRRTKGAVKLHLVLDHDGYLHKTGVWTESSAKAVTHCLRALLDPNPPLAFARALAEHEIVHAAMDLSDGVSGDLRTMCDESDVSAWVDGNTLPIDVSAASLERARGGDAAALALHGGEDYQLLLAVPREKLDALRDVAVIWDIPTTVIGEFAPGPSALLLKKGGSLLPLTSQAHDHFRGRGTGGGEPATQA